MVHCTTLNHDLHSHARKSERIGARIDRLTDQPTWEDIMYELNVKQKIEARLKAVEEGRTISHEETKRRLLAKKHRA